MKEETVSINLTRELMVYVSRNKKAWKKIDELHYKRYEECLDMQDEIDETIKEFEIDLKKETIESAFYMKRLVALMLLDEKAGFWDNIEKLISSVFTKAYKYAISSTVIKLSSYRARKVSRDISVDDMFSEFLALMLTADIYCKKIDREDSFYNEFLNTLDSVKAIDNGFLKSAFSYENCKKNRKAIINELELIIRARYFDSGYNFESFHRILVKRKCFSTDKYVKPIVSKFKNDVFAKMFVSTEYVESVLNKTSAGVLLENVNIKQNTIKAFINIYLEFSGYSMNEDIKIDKDDINIDELMAFVAICLIQALYIEAYSNTHDFFFDNYSENIRIQYKEVLDENREIKKNNLRLQDNIESLKLENEEFKKRISKLEKELDRTKSNNRELFELRNYIFNNQEDESDFVEDDIDLERLKDKKIVCFGGNKAWISSMSKEFDDWTFVPADTINFDVAILKNTDIVFIKSTYISHAMYYKIMANLEDATEIKFINNSNINRVKKELI